MGIREWGAVGSVAARAGATGRKDDWRGPGRHPTRVGSGRAAGPRTACPSRRRRVPRWDLGDRGVVRRRSVRSGDRPGIRAVSGCSMGSALAARASCVARLRPTRPPRAQRGAAAAARSCAPRRRGGDRMSRRPRPHGFRPGVSRGADERARRRRGGLGPPRTTARTRSRPTSNARSSRALAPHSVVASSRRPRPPGAPSAS